MNMTGLEVFETTLQKTNEWLQELMDELGIENRHHDSSRKIPTGEISHVQHALPAELRESWPTESKAQSAAR